MDILDEAIAIHRRSQQEAALLQETKKVGLLQANTDKGLLWDAFMDEMRKIAGQPCGKGQFLLKEGPTNVLYLYGGPENAWRNRVMWAQAGVQSSPTPNDECTPYAILSVRVYPPSTLSLYSGEILSITRLDEMPSLLQFVAKHISPWVA